MVLRGTIERITFRDEESLYTVAKLSSSRPGELVTVVGKFAALLEGESVELEGEFVTHPKFGLQFRVEHYKTVVPTSLEGIERYLSSSTIKGIGKKTARHLVHHFKEKTLDIIENHPERLREVAGIGEVKANRIIEGVREHRESQEVMVFLQGHNISPGYATRIYRHFREGTLSVVKQNPYRLADEVSGVGFKTADRLAKSMGIKPNSNPRLRAGLKFVLKEAASIGHTFLPEDELIHQAGELLEVQEGEMVQPLMELLESGELKAEKCASGRRIFLAQFYYAEMRIAAKIRLLTENSPAPVASLEKVHEYLARYEQEMGMKLANRQREAVVNAARDGVLVITGGPGTGKTTIVKAICWLMSKAGLAVRLAAPTGRAAKRLEESSGLPAKTIHRLLEYGFKDGEGMRFLRSAENPIRADVIIVDEASMLDLTLCDHLLQAVPPGCRMILVGDVDQLPPVGAGKVLRDLIDSGTISVIRLDQIFRQAKDSLITINAHRVNRGEFPFLNSRRFPVAKPGQFSTTRSRKKDFFFEDVQDPKAIHDTVVDLVLKRLPPYGPWDPMNDIQVLTPMRKTIIGVDRINLDLQAAFTSGKDLPYVSAGMTRYYLGDKVMQVRNNYDKGVFNGDAGRIAAIDRENQQVIISFGGVRKSYDFYELDDLTLAYAISVHKSQGSEYPVVVMPISTHHFVMLQRNLLYTAITRAKELVVLVGLKKAIGMAIGNNLVEERYSAVAERLRS